MCNPPIPTTGDATAAAVNSGCLGDGDNDDPSKTDHRQQQRRRRRRPPFWKPYRAIFAFVFNFPCIYVDIVASNYAVKRWQLLSQEQKEPLPDVLHERFGFFENHLLRESFPIVMYHLIILGFMIPYDVLGWRSPPSRNNDDDDDASSSSSSSSSCRDNYRRGECTIRFFETRCVLELMRACTVISTAMSDPRGIRCVETETSEIDDIWNTWTFARCGDNLYSGHASHVLSLSLVVQTYFLPMHFVRRRRRTNSATMTYRILSAALWSSTVYLMFYIVVSRMHYTVDVLTAVFLVPSVWFAWKGLAVQTDDDDEDAGIIGSSGAAAPTEKPKVQ